MTLSCISFLLFTLWNIMCTCTVKSALWVQFYSLAWELFVRLAFKNMLVHRPSFFDVIGLSAVSVPSAEGNPVPDYLQNSNQILRNWNNLKNWQSPLAIYQATDKWRNTKFEGEWVCMSGIDSGQTSEKQKKNANLYSFLTLKKGNLKHEHSRHKKYQQQQ